MGITRTDLYTAEQNQIASLAKAIGHPARVAILQHLLKVEGCVCGDLVHEIGLAQATISQHLKELKQIGIIKGNIEGTKVCYCINTTTFNQIKNIFNQLFGENPKLGNCC